MKNDQIAILGVAVVLYMLWKRETSVSLPTGTSIPMQGDPSEVPRVKTPLDAVGLPNLFNSALQVVEQAVELGPDHSPESMPPSDDYDLAARVFAMQCALETDDGRSLYHFNTGNVTTEQGQYFLNPPTDTKHHYAVFLYPLQGAVEQVRRIKRKWPDAYRAAFSGSVTGFCRGLKPANAPQYFEADEGTYRAGMLARGKRFGWDSGVAGPGVRKLRLAPPTRRA